MAVLCMQAFRKCDAQTGVGMKLCPEVCRLYQTTCNVTDHGMARLDEKACAVKAVPSAFSEAGSDDCYKPVHVPPPLCKHHFVACETPECYFSRVPLECPE